MPQATYPNPVRAARYGFQPNGFLFGLAPGGVFPATTVTNRAVRSYRTISPLPAIHFINEQVKNKRNKRAVYFLWHFP